MSAEMLSAFSVSLGLIKNLILDVFKVMWPVMLAIMGAYITWKIAIKYTRGLLNVSGGSEKERMDKELKSLEDEYRNHEGYESPDNEIFEDDDQWRDEEW